MSTIASSNPEPGTTHLRPAPLRHRPGALLVLALLIGIGLLRIVSTYHVFNHTIDEGAHLACGIQWFQGSYTYDQKHTPIARVSIALLPYLNGVRSYGNPSFWDEGVLVLSSGGHYWRNLTLARIGVLPYFVLAIVVIFLWTRRLYGHATALVAAGIFSALPVVLAHSALATTDIPLAVCYIIAVYAFTRWLESPNWGTVVGFGISTGLAVATKLSTVAFLPATMAGILLLYLAPGQRDPSGFEEKGWGLGSMRSLIRSIALAAICAFVILWASYKFSHASISEISPGPDKIVTRVFGTSSVTARGFHFLIANVQLPMPELLEGLRQLRDINAAHPPSYLFGHIKRGGWWYFYPVAITVKTPLAVLFFALIGAAGLGMRWFRTRENWQAAVPIVAFLSPIVIAAPTRLDIGVRHVMPVFAFLSMLAAVGAVRLWNYHSSGESQIGGWVGRAAVVILLSWAAVSSARAHPDYLSYFNELGGRTPENILVISDFDWGQDLARLSTYLREHQVQHISIAYDGFFDPSALGFPDMEYIDCHGPAAGWVAVEVRRARLYPNCYPWLGEQHLVTRVGKTMLIYYVTDSQVPGAPPAITENQSRNILGGGSLSSKTSE